jgi:signal transduction histidine kinase
VLRVPLFIKLIVADSAVAVAAVLVGAWLARRAVGMQFDLFAEPGLALAATLAALVTIGVNALIVRLALRPIHILERTADRVADGDTSARAPVSAFADRDFARVVETFNNVLDAAESNRRRLRKVAARSMHAAEEERKRIAQELHDGIAQTLAAMRVRLRLAHVGSGPDLDVTEIEALSEGLGAAIEEVRSIALGLRPPALDVLGLGPAVESLARSVARAARLRVEVHANVTDKHVVPEAQLAIYRILQEALANVVHHAEARSIHVRLETSNGHAELLVEDDGRGFTAAERLAGPGSLGLLGMQERAAYVGGRVEIKSTPGAGTRVLAEIPFS